MSKDVAKETYVAASKFFFEGDYNSLIRLVNGLSEAEMLAFYRHLGSKLTFAQALLEAIRKIDKG